MLAPQQAAAMQPPQQQVAPGGAPPGTPDLKRPRPPDEEEPPPGEYDGETMLAAAQEAATEESEALALVFQPYRPVRVTEAAMGGPVGTPHPETIVEAASMLSVLPPKPTYAPALDTRLLRPPAPGESSPLSSVQYESVVYAGQAHSGTVEPAPGLVCTRGFYIGDGTGVGARGRARAQPAARSGARLLARSRPRPAPRPAPPSPAAQARGGRWRA